VLSIGGFWGNESNYAGVRSITPAQTAFGQALGCAPAGTRPDTDRARQGGGDYPARDLLLRTGKQSSQPLRRSFPWPVRLPGTAAAIDRARTSPARGEGIPHEDILREFGLDK
jgi:hypothetical protein